MKLACLIAAMVLCAAPGAAAQTEPRPLPLPRPPVPLNEQQLRDEVPGNTFSGRHDSGMEFSEYHAPDGRIFGHNGDDPVRDGCWAIKGDSVCYSYERGVAPGVFCWRYFRRDDGRYRILLPRSGTLGTALRETGNPRSHSDNGQPWDCAPQVSRR